MKSDVVTVRDALDPFNPANRYHPENPFNSANRYNPGVPFASWDGASMGQRRRS